jgi:hypothetical protein
MKSLMILAAVGFALMLNTPATAQTHSSDTPAAAGSESHAGHAASPAPASPDLAKPQASATNAAKGVQMMQGHSQKMQGQMNKIKAAKDPKERQKLMQEHMATMQEGMKMMKDMPGCAMMAGQGMKGSGQGMMDMGNMMMCQQVMEKKLEMMQGMLEGLMDSSQMKK